jgi:hypothetical protein
MSPQNSSTEWGDMLDEMQRDKEASAGTRKYWQPPSDKEGTFPIRILPPLRSKGEKKFYFKHQIHWVDRIPYECLGQDLVDKNGVAHKAEDCPICSFVKKLYRTSEKNTDGWKLAGELRAKDRYDYRVVVRSTPEQQSDETKPVFFETGSTIFEMLFHIMKETDFGIIVDPKNGRDFNLVKKGLKRQSRYDQSLPSPNVSPIFPDAAKLKAMLDNAIKLDYSSLIEFTSAVEMDKGLHAYIGGEPATKQLAPRPRASEPTADGEFPESSKADDGTPDSTSTPGNEDAAIDDILKEFN